MLAEMEDEGLHDDGTNWFLTAVRCGADKVVEWFLKRDKELANVKAMVTALTETTCGSVPTLQVLLDACGPQVDNMRVSGTQVSKKLVCIAADCGRVAHLQMLLRAKANIDAPDAVTHNVLGCTSSPLQYAVERYDKLAVQTLLACWAKPKLADKIERFSDGSLRIVPILLHPLQDAVTLNSSNDGLVICRLLLKNGATLPYFQCRDMMLAFALYKLTITSNKKYIGMVDLLLATLPISELTRWLVDMSIRTVVTAQQVFRMFRGNYSLILLKENLWKVFAALIAHGADAGTHVQIYGKALSCAVWQRRPVLRALLAVKGTDVDESVITYMIDNNEVEAARALQITNRRPQKRALAVFAWHFNTLHKGQLASDIVRRICGFGAPERNYHSVPNWSGVTFLTRAVAQPTPDPVIVNTVLQLFCTPYAKDKVLGDLDGAGMTPIARFSAAHPSSPVEEPAIRHVRQLLTAATQRRAPVCPTGECRANEVGDVTISNNDHRECIRWFRRRGWSGQTSEFGFSTDDSSIDAVETSFFESDSEDSSIDAVETSSFESDSEEV
jgi:hypothetical protein